MLAGERAWNLKRAYNCRLGLTRASEKLPRLLLQPLPDGGQAGHVPDMELLLREYYQASGWDLASGWPLPEKLECPRSGFCKETSLTLRSNLPFNAPSRLNYFSSSSLLWAIMANGSNG